MKVYKFVHVQMNEFPEGNVKQHSHDEFENNLTTEALLPSVRFVFESLWRSVFQNYFILKSHLFVQDKHYELCSFKNLLIRSNGFNRLLMDAS